MNRRDFLDPRHVAQAAGQAAAAADEVQSALAGAPGREEVALLRLAWRAMATTYEILLPLETPGGVEAAQAAFALLDELEDQLSVYRDHSEVCQINRLAARRAVRVEERLFGLLQTAQHIHQASGGAFDITAGALIKAWGFFRGPRRVPSDNQRLAALACAGMQHVELKSDGRTVRFHRPGLEFNLGSIGKGHALDRLAELLRGAKVSAALLHGGSSSVVGYGDPHGTGQGWRVRIKHPWEPERYLAEVSLNNQALGTSAATFQYLEHEGKKLGHILDPRTGWPAAGLASVSVLAPTGELADGLSTAFYVGGVEVAQRYCASHRDVGAVILREGEESPLVIGLPAGVYTLL